MPVHFVYKEPDKTTLCQGDILCKTDPLVAHLAEYHPYYANHPDYKFFMVLTQSCDLVRRGDARMASPYITLAAVRPVEEVLRREAAKFQDEWQRKARVIGSKTKDKLMMFLESLLDNNREGYFYLHTEVDLGISQQCCAFLRLSVALKNEHYDLCLEAKTAELQESFQAKLGHLLGEMYSRVGTEEWNGKYPDLPVADAAAELLKKTFITFSDQQIKEGIAELQTDGSFETKTPDEISEHIRRTKVLPRKTKFKNEADALLKDHDLVDQICNQVQGPLKSDRELKDGLNELFVNLGVEDLSKATDAIIEKVVERLRYYLSDKNMPGRDKVLRKLVAKLVESAAISSLLNN